MGYSAVGTKGVGVMSAILPERRPKVTLVWTSKYYMTVEKSQ